MTKEELSKYAAHLGRKAQKVLKKKYGVSHFEKMGRASVESRRNLMTESERSYRAKLIRRGIKLSGVNPNEYEQLYKSLSSSGQPIQSGE